MKTFSFTTINSCNTNPCITTYPKSNEPDYSAILDAALDANIKKKNSCIFKDLFTPKSSNKTININICSSLKKDNNALINATKFLANLGNHKTLKSNDIMFKEGITYKLDDGTPIIFFDDSIQIGFDLFYFDDFKNPLFINNLAPKIKKTICTIYAGGLKIEIKK